MKCEFCGDLLTNISAGRAATITVRANTVIGRRVTVKMHLCDTCFKQYTKLLHKYRCKV